MPKRRICGIRFLPILLASLLFVGLLVAPSAALAKFKKNANLAHVGPSGLESYNAWTKKSSTLVTGMVGTWFYPVFSPSGVSVVTMKNSRPDRADSAEIYGAVVASTSPIELTTEDPDNGIGMTSFLGWLDDYQAVFQQYDPNGSGEMVTIARDVRAPSDGYYYDGTVTYPSTARKTTAWDRACRIRVTNKGVITITKRKKNKRVARFKLPKVGSGWTSKNKWTGWRCWPGEASISPDGKFLAYDLVRYPTPGSSAVVWRTYVCTIKGKSAKRIFNSNGGFVWK